MQIFLTQLQAFNAVYKFLDVYCKKNQSDDLNDLAGDMLFWADDTTADPAIWGDWLDAIENKKSLSKQEAYNGMIKFLDIYRSLGEEGDVIVLINTLNGVKNASDSSDPITKQWNLCLKPKL